DTVFLTDTNNLKNVDPMLGPLAFNGGPTQTHALLAGSPAIDKGSNPAMLTFDQRGPGFPRVVGPQADIGAVEISVRLPDRFVASGPPTGEAQTFEFDAMGMAQPVGAAFTPFPGFSGDVRATVGDFDGDGKFDVAYGIGPGGGSEVRLVTSGGADVTVTVYEATFTGGVFLAAGDFDGDGKDELVVSPDQGGGGRVVSFRFDGSNLLRFADFFGIVDPDFRGGARVGVGDLDGDGLADLLVAAGFTGGPRVAVFDGSKILANGITADPEPLKFIPDFFVFENTLRNGVFVTSGDITGDGKWDMIFGGGPGGGPRVLILDSVEVLAGNVNAEILNPVANFFAGDITQRGGIRLTTANIDDDARADLVTGSGEGFPAQVRTYLGEILDGFQATDTMLEPPRQELLTPFGGATLSAGVFVG
ncbi:MAG TPA: VCBS repeat-containing protein, partial [Gemmataceae bacterium]